MTSLAQRSLALAALILACGTGPASAQRPQPPRMPHRPAGKEQCLTCHGPGANQHVRSTPANHPYGATACPMCHRPSETPPPNIPHPLEEAMTDCRTCHVTDAPPGVPAPPASHTAYNVSICRMCHEPGTPPPPSR